MEEIAFIGGDNVSIIGTTWRKNNFMPHFDLQSKSAVIIPMSTIYIAAVSSLIRT